MTGQIIIFPESKGEDPIKHLEMFPNAVELSKEYETYSQLPRNEHHFTTKWHYENTLPVLIDLLKFNYKESDFQSISNINEFGDFSFKISKELQLYKVFTYKFITPTEIQFYNEFITSNEITGVGMCHDATTWPGDELNDSYHKLFKYPHTSVWIENQTLKEGKNLLIRGDSHMIPIIPILIRYYKNIVVIDDRIPVHILNYIDLEFDQELLALWENRTLDFYIR